MAKNEPLDDELSRLREAHKRALAIAWETPLDTPAFRRNRREVERIERAIIEATTVPSQR